MAWVSLLQPMATVDATIVAQCATAPLPAHIGFFESIWANIYNMGKQNTELDREYQAGVI